MGRDLGYHVHVLDVLFLQRHVAHRGPVAWFRGERFVKVCVAMQGEELAFDEVRARRLQDFMKGQTLRTVYSCSRDWRYFLLLYR